MLLSFCGNGAENFLLIGMGGETLCLFPFAALVLKSFLLIGIGGETLCCFSFAAMVLKTFC